MIIAIDFDGTCVTHEYPAVGRDIGAVPILQRLCKNHKLILWTMRSGLELEEAVNWFKDNSIPLWGVNSNPEQHAWTKSPKQYAQLYIDDAALGAPLEYSIFEDRPYINWKVVEEVLKNKGILFNE